MKFASFSKVEWPDDSYQNWFKAHGSAIQMREVSCLKEFGQFYLGEIFCPVSSSSWQTVLASECIAQITAPSSLPVAAPLQMANIPIDPR
jgi:hypothetical protein